jgi:tetratricopeptide (TPR) repeat protein
MRKQDFLLQLIATLSPSEKRYFKLFGSIQAGDKQYLRLFDALENKQQYDATLLSQELDWDTKQLASNKHYLSQMLVRSLGNKEETSVEADIYRSYIEAYALFERRLFNHALDLAEKAIDNAKQHDQFLALPSLIFLKQRCLYALQRHIEVPALAAEFKAANDASTEIFDLNLLRCAITDLEQQRNENGLRELFNHPLLKSKVEDLKSIKAQVIWFDMMTTYLMFYGTDIEFEKMMKAEVAHYEKHPHIKVIQPEAYLYSYAKVARAEKQLRAHDEALAWLEKFLALLDKPPLSISAEKVKAMKRYGWYLMSRQLRVLNRFDEAVPFAEKSYKHVPEGYPYEKIGAMYEYAESLFQAGRFKDVADKLDELLQLNTDAHVDLQISARLLMVLTQLELGNNAVVPYQIKSAKSWLKRQKRVVNGVDIFFKYTYAIAKARPNEIMPLLKELNIAADEGGLGELHDLHFPVKWWIERQIAKYKRPV